MPLAVYLATRVLYLVIAIVDSIVRGWPIINAGSPFLSEVTNWDGMWYVRLAVHGYPHGYIATPLEHYQTTLGFFPLYSMAIWVVWHALLITPDDAGLLISIVGGSVGPSHNYSSQIAVPNENVTQPSRHILNVRVEPAILVDNDD